MKITTTLLGCLLCAILTLNLAYSQSVPSKINYQAVARNATGAVIPNQNISIRFSIHSTSSVGPIVYQETHALKTNQFGLFTANIGGGTVIQGTWNTIPWATTDAFLRVEMDATGGINYVDMGTTQFLSVPFSLQAQNAASANALSATATGVVRSINGSEGAITLEGGGGTTINKSGDVITISSSGGTGGTGIQGVQNTDGILQITNSNGPTATINVNNASITAGKLAADVIPSSLPPTGAAGGDLLGTYPNPGVAKIQGHAVASIAPITGQILTYDGTQWTPGTPVAGWSLTGNTAINPATNYLGTSDTQPLIIRTNNIERLRILGTGKVGIGTSSPIQALDVNGRINVTDGAIQRGGDPIIATDLGLYSRLATKWLRIVTNNGDIKFWTNEANGISDPGYNAQMTISTNGNVGIGTTTDPAAKLDVNGAVMIRTTTQTPLKNTIYGNSTPIAYGSYINGSLVTKYGVTSVAPDATGEFIITLTNAISGSPVVMVTPWDYNTPRVYSWYAFDATHIGVKFFTVAGVASSPSGFSFVVFGNLQ